MDWTYIDNINSLESTKFIHVDTRDFHILCSDYEDSEFIQNLLKKVRYCLKQNLFQHNEIIDILKKLETRSGGVGKWRFLTFDNLNIWIKYIRFVKVSNTEYVAYTGISDKFYQLSKEDLISRNIIKETLNFIK